MNWREAIDKQRLVGRDILCDKSAISLRGPIVSVAFTPSGVMFKVRYVYTWHPIFSEAWVLSMDQRKRVFIPCIVPELPFVQNRDGEIVIVCSKKRVVTILEPGNRMPVPR